MAENLKKFGKYFLLDQIAQGGMAEIYRARMATPDGGGRLLAIKRIIQSYSSSPEFVTMFKSEIKTTSGFTHPNIVQLYDYGEEQSLLYIAMEFVDGKNLRQFTSRFAELKAPFPVEAAVYIIEQAAHGMGYAHAYKDKFSGKSLNIVHRDISPQNLLISYDGAVKVIDFGIAKAVTNAESTRAGVIKGKPSYLSPEQISGDSLDGRSDIFALGIVLWELLAGRKLFAAENDFAVLKLIENCATHVKPPSMYNPKVTKDLDAIVLKCLQKNRDHRYATAEELQRALHKLLYQFAPDFNPADLAYYARDLFKNEIVEDRKRLLKLNEKAEQLLAAEGGNEGQTLAVVMPEGGLRTELSVAAPRKPQPKANQSGSFRVVDFGKKDDKTDVKLDFGAAGIAAKQSKGAAAGYAPPATSTKFTRPSRSGVSEPNIIAPEKASSLSRFTAALLLALGAAGYWYYLGDKKGPAPASGQQETAVLEIKGNVKVATVMIDERQVANALPVTLSSVPAGRSFRLTVSSNGYQKHVEELNLEAGESKTVSVGLTREGEGLAVATASPSSSSEGDGSGHRPVTLRINVSPPGFGTQMKIDGTPVDSSGVAMVDADTPFELVVERDGFKTHREQVRVESARLGGKTEWEVSVSLEAAKFGFVSIKTTPSADVLITIDGVEEKWSTPISRRRIPVGSYSAKLVNALLGMEKQVSFSVGEDRFTNIEERLTINDEPVRAPGAKR